MQQNKDTFLAINLTGQLNRDCCKIGPRSIAQLRELRALRNAEQNTGNSNFNVTGKLKRGVAMVKQMLGKAGNHKNSALVILGWLSFFGSFLTNDLTLVVSLQTVARVLP